MQDVLAIKGERWDAAYAGGNDRQAHARALARYLSPLKTKLNLIALNPSPDSQLKPPSVAAYERFHSWLVAEKVFVRRRDEKGGRIMAACGQLGGRSNAVARRAFM